MTLFTENFVNDILKEISAAQNPSNSDVPLWKIDFEQNMLAILKFYITPVLCYHFMGYYKEYRGAASKAHNLQKGEILEFEPINSQIILNLIVPLNQQGKDFQGGGFSFIRYYFLARLEL